MVRDMSPTTDKELVKIQREQLHDLIKLKVKSSQSTELLLEELESQIIRAKIAMQEEDVAYVEKMLEVK